jgi:hypothetical protein
VQPHLPQPSSGQTLNRQVCAMAPKVTRQFSVLHRPCPRALTRLLHRPPRAGHAQGLPSTGWWAPKIRCCRNGGADTLMSTLHPPATQPPPWASLVSSDCCLLPACPHHCKDLVSHRSTSPQSIQLTMEHSGGLSPHQDALCPLLLCPDHLQPPRPSLQRRWGGSLQVPPVTGTHQATAPPCRAPGPAACPLRASQHHP